MKLTVVPPVPVLPPEPPPWLEVLVPPRTLAPPEPPVWLEVVVPPRTLAPPEPPVWLEVVVPPRTLAPPEPPVWLEVVVPPVLALPPELAVWLDVAVPPVLPPELAVWLEVAVPPVPVIPPPPAWLAVVVPPEPVVPPDPLSPPDPATPSAPARSWPGPDGRSSIHAENSPTNTTASRPWRKCRSWPCGALRVRMSVRCPTYHPGFTGTPAGALCFEPVAILPCHPQRHRGERDLEVERCAGFLPSLRPHHDLPRGPHGDTPA